MKVTAAAIEFLIVDERSGVSEFLSGYLERQKHTCTAVRDEQSVRKWLAENRCEVALVDLNMIAINSLAVVSQIRRLDVNVPIIGFSENGWADDKVNAAICAGANGHVSKNLPAEQLYCVLARVLATARFYARRVHSPRRLLGAA